MRAQGDSAVHYSYLGTPEGVLHNSWGHSTQGMLAAVKANMFRVMSVCIYKGENCTLGKSGLMFCFVLSGDLFSSLAQSLTRVFAYPAGFTFMSKYIDKMK